MMHRIDYSFGIAQHNQLEELERLQTQQCAEIEAVQNEWDARIKAANDRFRSESSEGLSTALRDHYAQISSAEKVIKGLKTELRDKIERTVAEHPSFVRLRTYNQRTQSENVRLKRRIKESIVQLESETRASFELEISFRETQRRHKMQYILRVRRELDDTDWARFRTLIDVVTMNERTNGKAGKQEFVRTLQSVLDSIFSLRGHLRGEFKIMFADPFERELLQSHYGSTSRPQIECSKDRNVNVPANAVKSKTTSIVKDRDIKDRANDEVFWWGSHRKCKTKIRLRGQDMSVGSHSFAYDKIQSLGVDDTSLYHGDPPSECCLTIGTEKGVVLLEADSRADRDFWNNAISKKKKRNMKKEVLAESIDLSEQQQEIQQTKEQEMRLKLQMDRGMAINKWSTEQVVAWIVSLDHVNYSCYEQEMLRMMTEEGVDGKCIDDDVSRADLKRWGITLYKHNKHILREIRGLIQGKIKNNIAA